MRWYTWFFSMSEIILINFTRKTQQFPIILLNFPLFIFIFFLNKYVKTEAAYSAYKKKWRHTIQLYCMTSIFIGTESCFVKTPQFSLTFTFMEFYDYLHHFVVSWQIWQKKCNLDLFWPYVQMKHFYKDHWEISFDLLLL